MKELLETVEDDEYRYESFDLVGAVGDARVSFFVAARTVVIACSTPHRHGDYELLYALSGSGKQKVEKEKIPVERGDVFLIRPRETHWFEPDEAIDVERCSFRFSIDLKAKSRAEEKANENLRLAMERVRLVHDGEGRLRSDLLAIEDELRKKEMGYVSSLQALCVRIFVSFLRLAGEANEKIFASESLRYGNYWRMQLEKFVDTKYMKHVSVNDLAAKLCLSARQTSRLLQKEMGRSFVELLNDARVEHVKMLIDEGESIGDAATACGFQSYSHFVSCFKARMGMTPVAYSRAKEKGAETRPAKKANAEKTTEEKTDFR